MENEFKKLIKSQFPALEIDGENVYIKCDKTKTPIVKFERVTSEVPGTIRFVYDYYVVPRRGEKFKYAYRDEFEAHNLMLRICKCIKDNIAHYLAEITYDPLFETINAVEQL